MFLTGKEKSKKLKNKYKLGILILLISCVFFVVPLSLQLQESNTVVLSVNQANAAWYDYIISVPSSIGGALGDAGKWIVTKIAEFLIRSILFVIFAILWCIYYIIYSLVGASEWILSLIFDPAFVQNMGGFTQAQFVRKTAALVSNICNIVYLLVLLYIAILSMLGRAETGRWLKKLVIAALLTNFSLVISGVIIDLSQILMYSFPMGKSGTESSNGSEFNIGTTIIDNIEKKILKIGGQTTTNVDPSKPLLTDQLGNMPDLMPSEEIGSSFWTVAGALFLFKMTLGEAISKIIQMLELVIFCVAMMITLISVASILIVRIVALWLLLIVSPAAFLLYSFPPTEKYFSIWIDSLVKYAFTGPILIFFLYVAKKISDFMDSSSSGNMSSYLSKKAGGIVDTPSLKDDLMVFVANNFQVTFQFIVVIITIWAGIIIANKFGIKGASSADQLINKTSRWSKRALVAVGGGVVASKMATWTGFGLANKLRANKLNQLNASLGENQAKLAGLDPESSEYSSLSQQVEDQKTQKDLLESKMRRSTERKNRVMKAFALTSPSLLKKRFSGYLESRNKEYYSDVNNNLSDFTNYWFNRGKSIKIQTANAKEQSYEIQNEIDKLTKDLAVAKNDEEANDIKEKIKHYVESLLKLSVKDEEKRKSLLPQLMQEIEDKAKQPSVIRNLLDNDKLKNNTKVDAEKKNISGIFNSIDAAINNGDAVEYKKQLSNLSQEINKIKLKDPSLANESFILEAQKKIGEAFRAKFLPTSKGPSIRDRFAAEIPAIAKETALNYLSGSKLREETAKKINEKMEGFKKDPMLNKDLLARKFAREELDPIEREAVLSFFSSSARDMSTLVRSINKEKGRPDGDIKNAMEFIESKTSQFATMRAFNNVQADADKSKNLTLIGHTIFDKTSGTYRSATKEERTQSLNRTLSGMSDKGKLSKISPAVFQYDNNSNSFNDPLAVKTVINSIDFNRMKKNRNLSREIVEDIASNTKKSLSDNETHFSNLINDPAQQTAFSDFVGKHLK